MTYDRTGGLAVVLAHPADEAFTCAGSLALAHDAGQTTRLLIVTRGEAGNPQRTPTPTWPPSASRRWCAPRSRSG